VIRSFIVGLLGFLEWMCLPEALNALQPGLQGSGFSLRAQTEGGISRC
jgi:hypothetical protein